MLKYVIRRDISDLHSVDNYCEFVLDQILLQFRVFLYIKTDLAALDA